MVPSKEHGVSGWLQRLTSGKQLTKKTSTVLRVLSANPRMASYESVSVVAKRAGVSISTITRAAQGVGFSGWPAFQDELRAVYISSLSVAEISAHRQGAPEMPSYAWISRDRDNLNNYAKTADFDKLARVAQCIADSKRAFVVGMGSYNGVGQILAHTADLYGYDVRLITESAQVANAVAHQRPGDLFIIINFWRIYSMTNAIVDACTERGGSIILIGENIPREVEEKCLESIRIPTEAVGFSPSLTVVMSAIHAIVAELQNLNKEYSTLMVQAAETEWSRFFVLHRT